MFNLVHFTYDESLGLLLTQIAREHLLYNYDPEKAINTLTESLIGMSREQALEIIIGSQVITVSEDNESIFMSDYDPNTHIEYEKLDIHWYINSLSKIDTQSKQFVLYIQELRRKNFIFTFSVSDMLKGISSNFESVVNTIEDDEDVASLEHFVSVVKEFISVSIKKILVAKFMYNIWIKDDDKILMVIKIAENNIARLSMRLQEAFIDLPIVNEVDKKIDVYLSNVREIDRIATVGIKPIDLLSGPDACWLSPNGVCYGLNGGIENMLHDQIASMLVDVGIVPTKHEHGDNNHLWLLVNGWVKIHGKEVGFEAHMNKKFGNGKNRFMTRKQIDMIVDYSRQLHGGILTFSFQPISALLFQGMIKNTPNQFYNKYLFGDLV